MTSPSISYQPAPDTGYHRYPVAHWEILHRFAQGTERDPKDQFTLADDTWEAWKYAAGGTPSLAIKYRFHFGHLTSFLRLYVKWYCYQRLLGADASVRHTERGLPYYMSRADHYLTEHGYTCLDEIASAEVFADLWRSLIRHPPDAEGRYSWAAAHLQSATHTFWLWLQSQFGIPYVMPPIIPYVQKRPGDYAVDESKLIPDLVVRQLANVLGLHRTGQERLNRYHHLRWCVLMIMLTVGRRIDEVLSIPRGNGPEGPLHVHPAKGMPEGALWLEFTPNKNGPHSEVHIYPESADLVRYCVHTLLRYGDEVRHLALPEDAWRLILVSGWNWTANRGSAMVSSDNQDADVVARFEALQKARQQRPRGYKPVATVLTYMSFINWLNGEGTPGSRKFTPGIMTTWHITTDGAAEGPIYRLLTHQARHTRQTVLAGDPTVPPVARQYDLNHHLNDMQFPYQHAFREQHRHLQDKLHQARLVGPGAEWYAEVTGLSERTGTPQSAFRAGRPTILNNRWRLLLVSNPQFFQTHRVFGGLCALPSGPGGCIEYLNCAEAHDDGCEWFCVDVDNEDMLLELALRVRWLRAKAEESAAGGRTVQAEKYGVLATRAEHVQHRVIQQVTQSVRERLQQRIDQLGEHA